MAGGVVRARGAGGQWRVSLALALVVTLLVTAAGNPVPTLAATLTVTNGNDSGAGSLRQMIADANPGDTIVFAQGVTGVTLTSAGLILSKNVTIQGSGQGGVRVERSREANIPLFRIFRVTSGVTATLQGLTISYGYGETFSGSRVGGGIFSQGTLTLVDSNVGGTDDGNFADFGGGIFVLNAGATTLTNVTISENTASGGGGGLYAASSGTLTLTGSTVSGNQSNSGGGGLLLFGTVTLTNSTVSGNAGDGDGGGIALNSGTLTLRNSTISGNTTTGVGGGLYASGAATVTGSIVVGNTGGDCAGGSITSGGYNVVGGGGGCPSGGNGDLAYTGALTALIAPLANNGGSTQTHALPPGSPAIDRVPAAQCGAAGGVDQRGITRPQPTGGACDSGALESTDASLVVTNGNDGGAGSLRAALALATPGGTITFAPGVTVVTLTSGELTINTSVTIQGSGMGGVRVRRSGAVGTPNFCVFRMPYGGEGTSVAIQGLTISGGNNGSTVSVENTGGILSEGGTLTLTNSIVSGNTGVGISVHLGTLTLTNSTVSGNTSDGDGGGIWSLGGTLTVTNSTINGNASRYGGGIYLRHATLTVTNSTINGNAAEIIGGGISCHGRSLLTVINSTVSGNSTDQGDGGGISAIDCNGENGDGMVTVTNSTVTGNTSGTSNGGGIYVYSPRYTLTSSLVVGNTGGDCATYGDGVLTSGGYNVVGSGCPADGTGDLAYAGALAALLDPALAFNGGPTRTHALPPGSLAIDRLPVAQCGATGGVDQRGAARPHGPACDSGAYEALTAPVVTNGNDSGAGSLREALALVNPGGTITFAPDVATVTLTSGELIIDRAVTILGRGVGGVTVQRSGASGTPDFSIFMTVDSATANAEGTTLQGLTIRNGSYVGISMTNEITPLALIDTIVRDNLRGGIDVGNGGGVSGPLTLTNSIVSGNTGVGISSEGGTLTLTNSTVSGNTGGGLSFNNGTVTVRFATITGNGGGIDVRNSGSLSLEGSIVAGNGGTDCAASTATSQGYNVVGSNTGCPVTGTDLAYTGAIAALINPSLAADGTHALPLGSPALNRVPTNQCANANGVDQRGVARPQGPGCDSGAFELRYYALTTAPIGGIGPASGNYPAGTVVTVTPSPAPGQTFVGWTVDGVYRGWAPSLTITLGDAHTVQANFAPTKRFAADVPSNHPNYTAITALASRGNILGYNASSYGPGDPVQRAQMAVLIARATPFGPGTPTNGTLTPPGCTVAGTWDCEDWGNTFTDRGGVPASLWRAAGTLQHYSVAFGYDGAACAARGVASPCYAPTAPVSYVETITFITRAMIAKGYWVAQPNAPQPYAGVPAVFTTPVATYAFYTGGVPAPPANWNAGANRGWFAEALWAALDAYWGTDGTLPDNRDAGGFVP